MVNFAGLPRDLISLQMLAETEPLFIAMLVIIGVVGSFVLIPPLLLLMTKTLKGFL
jgi:hypothetical protein